VTAAVKEAIGRFAARMLPQEEARARLKTAAKEALLKRATIQPFRLNAPYNFDVEFLTSAQAEMPLMLPGVKRTAARAVGFTATDYLEGFRMLRGIIALASAG
jgi:D-amino peptidase